VKFLAAAIEILTKILKLVVQIVGGFADHQVPVECFIVQSLLEAVVVGVDVGVADKNVPVL
jgi:hypothetical protein